MELSEINKVYIDSIMDMISKKALNSYNEEFLRHQIEQLLLKNGFIINYVIKDNFSSIDKIRDRKLNNFLYDEEDEEILEICIQESSYKNMFSYKYKKNR